MYLKEKVLNHPDNPPGNHGEDHGGNHGGDHGGDRGGDHGKNTPPIGTEIEMEKLRKQIGSPVLSELLGLAIESIESELEKLEQAIRKGDFEDIKLVAHTIKGTAASMFALRLSEQAKILESRSKNLQDAADQLPRVRDTALETFSWWKEKAT